METLFFVVVVAVLIVIGVKAFSKSKTPKIPTTRGGAGGVGGDTHGDVVHPKDDDTKLVN